MSYYSINIFEADKEILKPYLNELGILIPHKIIPVPEKYKEIINKALTKESYSICSSDDDFELKEKFREWQLENWETTNIWINVYYFNFGFAFETNHGCAGELVLKIISNNSNEKIIVRTIDENANWQIKKYINGKEYEINKMKMFEEETKKLKTNIERHFFTIEDWKDKIGKDCYEEFEKLTENKEYIPNFFQLKEEWFE